MSDQTLDEFVSKNSERAREYREIIDSMLGDTDYYGYAESTLQGILEYIEENDSITDAQVQAIDNIRDRPSEGYGL